MDTMENELIDFVDIGNTTSFDLTTSLSISISYSENMMDSQTIGNKRKRDDNDDTLKKRSCYQDVVDKESTVNHSWDTLGSRPDIHGMFSTFNRQYFWGILDDVKVQWSKRMTVCAGICDFDNGFCCIRLSDPLLKLRPHKNLVETLLHEMIHAYLFLTNNQEHMNKGEHGSEFCRHMNRINHQAGINISIYHDFDEEVKLCKQHWWRCNGPCQSVPPVYGYVKRSMNRAPGPKEKWLAAHQATCGGHFIKVKTPEGYGLKKKTTINQFCQRIKYKIKKQVREDAETNCG